MSSCIDDISVDSSRSQCLSSVDDDIERERCNRPIVSSLLNFLSMDQKVVLAQGSSMASKRQDGDPYQQQPGAYSFKEDGVTRMTQKKMMQKNQWMTNFKRPSQVIEENRKPPPIDDGPLVGSTEISSLEEIHDRMNRFRQDLELEIQIQDEDPTYYEQKRKRRVWWGLCISSIALLFVLSLVIPLSIQYANVTTSYIPPESDASTFSTECQFREMFDKQNYDIYRSFLISTYPNMTTSIDTQGISANNALCWLSQDDNLVLNLSTGNDGKILAQRFVVVILYFHFLGNDDTLTNDYNIFSRRNWLSEKDVCEWTQIGCHKSTTGFQYVTSLSFSDIVLKDAQNVPSEIALLPMLRQLIFDPNNFSGTIPTELSTLTHLEEFAVKFSTSTNGNDVGNVMKHWTQLQQLRLEIPFSTSLPQFASLKNLRQLHIIDPSRLRTYAFPDLRNLNALESLTLFVHLKGSFPTYLGKFSNLELLGIILPQGILAEEITSLSNLKSLKLLDISGTLPSEIGNLSNLTTLLVSSQSLEGFIPTEIGKLSKLQLLQIDFPSLISGVPDEICILSQKENVDVTVTSNGLDMVAQHCT